MKQKIITFLLMFAFIIPAYAETPVSGLGVCQFPGECGASAQTCPNMEQCIIMTSGKTVCVPYGCKPEDADDYDPNDPTVSSEGDTLDRTINISNENETFISIDGLLSATYKLLYPAAILIGFLFVIVAGYKYMSSEGDPQKVKEAQNDVASAIAGMLFVLLSATILRIVINNILGGNLQI